MRHYYLAHKKYFEFFLEFYKVVKNEEYLNRVATQNFVCNTRTFQDFITFFKDFLKENNLF